MKSKCLLLFPDLNIQIPAHIAFAHQNRYSVNTIGFYHFLCTTLEIWRVINRGLESRRTAKIISTSQNGLGWIGNPSLIGVEPRSMRMRSRKAVEDKAKWRAAQLQAENTTHISHNKRASAELSAKTSHNVRYGKTKNPLLKRYNGLILHKGDINMCAPYLIYDSCLKQWVTGMKYVQ